MATKVIQPVLFMREGAALPDGGKSGSGGMRLAVMAPAVMAMPMHHGHAHEKVQTVLLLIR